MNAVSQAADFADVLKETVQHVIDLRNALAVTSALLECRDEQSGGTETSRRAVSEAKRLLDNPPRCLV